MIKTIIVVCDTEASNEALKKAFENCGLIDIKYVEVKDETKE